MSTAEKTLEKMRNNPRDWRIEDMIAVAQRYGMVFRNEGGSHYHFSHADVAEHVSIPAHRPIKQVYIREFVCFIDTIIDITKERAL
jgi:predicted RNA binding protein YcfA (HicA-like mRNA interferase family)